MSSKENELKQELVVEFPRQYIPDFFNLLFWNLDRFNCLSSSNYVFQDISRRIHEFRYEVCVLLTNQPKAKDLSEYSGTHMSLVLTPASEHDNRHRIVIKLGQLKNDKDALPRNSPWRRELLRIPRGLFVSVRVTLKKIKHPKDLTLKEISLAFGNVKKAINTTVNQITKGPANEYAITQFFKSGDYFFDCYYEIGSYKFCPAHRNHRHFGDNYICISTLSKEFTPNSARRKHFYELSTLGMFLGLICNIHFSVCDYVPQHIQKEWGISNIQPCVEPASKSKLIDFMKEFPKGHLVSISGEESRYNNIRLPIDTVELFEKYFQLPDNKKQTFNETLCCFQMSLDLKSTFPTMSMISLFSAMENMTNTDKVEIKKSAICPKCGFIYDPVCPNCNKRYRLQAAKWKGVLEFINKYVSLTEKEKSDLEKILKDSYHRMRSAGVHSAKLRGLEYETSEKKSFYLPDTQHFAPSWLSIDYYYKSLKQIFVSSLIEWLKQNGGSSTSIP